MAGSNIEATRYSGIDTKRTIMLVYTLSGVNVIKLEDVKVFIEQHGD